MLPSEPIIHADQVRFAYPDRGFTLSVESLFLNKGEAVALTGPSGSGKSTLLNLLAGILVPQTGRIRVHGVEISSLDDRARRDFRIAATGLIFQEFELLEYLSVLDNLLLPYRISRTLRLDRQVRDRASMLAERVGIAGQLQRHPRNLSQGERQRVAFCRALLPRPRVILADEPTGHLDPDNRDRLLGVLFEYLRHEQATLLAVTHEHDLLDRFERVLDMARLREMTAA